MRRPNRNNVPNNARNNDEVNYLLPGLYSPLTWTSFLMGTGLLVWGGSPENHERAICFLTVAFTFLKTDNVVARGISVAGATLRIVSNGVLGAAGFFMQACAAVVAVIPSEEAAEAMGRAEEEERQAQFQ